MTLITSLSTEIKTLLQTEKNLPLQVLNVLIDSYQQSEETLPVYFSNNLSTLSDVDLDLIFSPAFTPTMAEKSAVFTVLKEASLSQSQIHELIAQLRDVVVSFNTPMGYSCKLNPIPEINLDRFVRLMGLDKPIQPHVYEAILSYVANQDQPIINVLARDTIWQNDTRQAIFKAFLSVLIKTPDILTGRMQAMSDFIRTYRPQDLNQLIQQLESYIRSCEADLNRSETLHFHDDRLREKYLSMGEGNLPVADEGTLQHGGYVAMMDNGRQLRDICLQVDQQYPEFMSSASVSV